MSENTTVATIQSKDNLEFKIDRKYKCGCVCPTLSGAATEENICPACLVKNNNS
jgi:hypothetical protein